MSESGNWHRVQIVTETGRLPLLNKILFASGPCRFAGYFLLPANLDSLLSGAPGRGRDGQSGRTLRFWALPLTPGVFAGFLILAGRFIDAFTDPLIGWWSDRTHSRWGRRIPFILFSTPFYALFAALIWFLPTEHASLWECALLRDCPRDFLHRCHHVQRRAWRRWCRS